MGSHGPEGLDVDGNGNVYVVGKSSHNVFRIDGAGVPVEIADFTGDGMGNALVAPIDVVADASGNVFVAGELSDNVLQIDSGGQISEIIGILGDGLGHFLLSPSCLGVAPLGDVFVCGRESHNVFRVDPGGAITQIIDSTGDGVAPLEFPNALVVDAVGNVFVAAGTHGGNTTVFRVTPSGSISSVSTPSSLESAAGIALAPGGGLIVAGQASHSLWRVREGESATLLIDSKGTGSDLTAGAARLAIDSAKSLYIRGQAGTLRLPEFGAPEVLPSAGLSAPIVRDILWDEDDVLMMAEPTGILGYRVSTGELFDVATAVHPPGWDFRFLAGRASSPLFASGFQYTAAIDETLGSVSLIPTGIGFMTAIAVDGNGLLYGAGFQNVTRREVDGTISVVMDSTGDGVHPFASFSAGGLVFDSAGNLFVASSDNDRVFRISTSGEISLVLDGSGDGTGNILDYPIDMAVDPSGYLFVAGRSSDNVFRVSPTGAITEIASSDGDRGPPILKPVGMAVTSDGTLYVLGEGEGVYAPHVVRIQSVPEPRAVELAILGLGLIAFLEKRRRRRRGLDLGVRE